MHVRCWMAGRACGLYGIPAVACSDPTARAAEQAQAEGESVTCMYGTVCGSRCAAV